MWYKTEEASSWVGTSIWYARVAAENTQPEVREMDNIASIENEDKMSFESPILHCFQDGRILIFWNNAVGSRTGRFFQISPDNGITWQPVKNAFADQLSGQTGPAKMIEDGNGNIHLVTSAYGPDQITAIRYAITDSLFNLSNYQTLWPEDQGQFPDLALAQGNQLLLVWSNNDGLVLFTTTKIDAPEEFPPKAYRRPHSPRLLQPAFHQ